MRAGNKFALQAVVALALGGYLLLAGAARDSSKRRCRFPFFKTFNPDLGWFYPLFVLLVLTGSANAVNLTDGLDGLAIGSLLIVWGAFSVLAYAAGHAIVADYLTIHERQRRR